MSGNGQVVAIKISNENIPPALYVVATPIGNLEDVTIRALKVLKNCDIILCEDTRKTLILAQKWGITGKLLSIHKFNERKKLDFVIDKIKQGKSCAYVTSGGTPSISDPGAILVRGVRQAELPVRPIPGPSAVISAVSISGWNGGFVFAGFLSRKKNARKKQLNMLIELPFAIVIFESPKRTKNTLKEIALIAPCRKVMIAREMTKLFEQIIEDNAQELNEKISENIKGEITIIIFPEEKKT